MSPLDADHGIRWVYGRAWWPVLDYLRKFPTANTDLFTQLELVDIEAIFAGASSPLRTRALWRVVDIYEKGQRHE